MNRLQEAAGEKRERGGVGEGGYLEKPPELVCHAAEAGQKVTDEDGPGAAPAQHHQAPAQVLRRQLRSNISMSDLHPGRGGGGGEEGGKGEEEADGVYEDRHSLYSLLC